MPAPCAVLRTACSFRKTLTRACKSRIPDHTSTLILSTMPAPCAVLRTACSFRKTLTRACKINFFLKEQAARRKRCAAGRHRAIDEDHAQCLPAAQRFALLALLEKKLTRVVPNLKPRSQKIKIGLQSFNKVQKYGIRAVATVLVHCASKNEDKKKSIESATRMGCCHDIIKPQKPFAHTGSEANSQQFYKLLETTDQIFLGKVTALIQTTKDGVLLHCYCRTVKEQVFSSLLLLVTHSTERILLENADSVKMFPP
ncbi:hypothetical protein J6590_029379 [Homalodisca vitripennis]|nr:hypothetical protein J6590_029379 [Homalodisca vitripennis]